MTWSEVYTALSQGVVDGVENAIDELYNQKLHEVQKHISLTRHIYVAVPIVINEQFYKGLPEEYQQIISDAAKESVLYRRELLKTSEDKALADMKKSGIEVVTDPDIEAFAERAKAVWEEFVDGEVITWDLVNRVKDY
jgi:C4-dicarboxylate-binding protein DctP